MGEWGQSVKEYSLYEFQCWIGNKIPREDAEDYYKPFSSNKNTLRWRRWNEKKNKNKQDYEDYLREMRNNMKNEKK